VDAVIELTDEMKAAFRAAQEQRAAELVAEGAPLGGHDILDRGLAAVLAIVARDRCMERRGHGYHPPASCRATVETKGTTVRCGKPADAHDAHLGRHEGWDVVW
jgi:hypothetical protein